MTDQDASPDARNDTRPKILTLLSILIILFSFYQLVRFSLILFNWKILASLPLSVEPGLLLVGSLVWSGAGMLIAVSLWRGKRWARIGCIAYGITYSVFGWINLLWIVEPSTLQDRWPVNLAFTLIGLGVLVAILNLKSTRNYFGRNAGKIP